MNRKPIQQNYKPLMRGVMAALKRAAKRARIEAERTHTCLIVSRGKGFVRISPSRLDKPASGTKPVR